MGMKTASVVGRKRKVSGMGQNLGVGAGQVGRVSSGKLQWSFRSLRSRVLWAFGAAIENSSSLRLKRIFIALRLCLNLQECQGCRFSGSRRDPTHRKSFSHSSLSSAGQASCGKSGCLHLVVACWLYASSSRKAPAPSTEQEARRERELFPVRHSTWE